MTRWMLLPGGRLALTLAALALVAGAVRAQSPGYPYWGTSPQSYRGSDLRVPVPGASPNISNAARSGSVAPGSAGSLGGAYLPPSLRTRDLDLPLPEEVGDNRAHLYLKVPRDAELWVEGVKTKQTGERRYYYSPPLAPGQRYAYRVRVRWTKDGKVVEENQRLVVSAGAMIRRDFTQSKPDDSAARK
jgi:uncharacterized protein (TIGR03000 family)